MLIVMFRVIAISMVTTATLAPALLLRTQPLMTTPRQVVLHVNLDNSLRLILELSPRPLCPCQRSHMLSLRRFQYPNQKLLSWKMSRGP